MKLLCFLAVVAESFYLLSKLCVKSRGSPGGSEVENLPTSVGDMGSIPGPQRPHMLRSSQARTPRAGAQATCLEPALPSRRSDHRTAPALPCGWRAAPAPRPERPAQQQSPGAASVKKGRRWRAAPSRAPVSRSSRVSPGAEPIAQNRMALHTAGRSVGGPRPTGLQPAHLNSTTSAPGTEGQSGRGRSGGRPLHSLRPEIPEREVGWRGASRAALKRVCISMSVGVCVCMLWGCCVHMMNVCVCSGCVCDECVLCGSVW